MSSSKTEKGGEQEVRVSTHSGYRADERPLHFILEGRKHVVKKVLDRWREPDEDYFRVKTADDQVHVLKREREADRWFVIRKE